MTSAAQNARWGRTSQRTSHGKPRAATAAGGSMTTVGGDVDMRESYSSYLERSVAGDEMTDALPDIDLYDHDNPLAVTEYVNDIYDYWYRVEVRAKTREIQRLRTRDARAYCVCACERARANRGIFQRATSFDVDARARAGLRH